MNLVLTTILCRKRQEYDDINGLSEVKKNKAAQKKKKKSPKKEEDTQEEDSSEEKATEGCRCTTA